MNTYILLYNETSFFEVVLVAYFMKTVGNVFIISEQKENQIFTNEGVKLISDISVDEVDVNGLDVFIICGGETNNIKDIAKINRLIKECKEKNKILGGICAGCNIIKDALNITLEINSTKLVSNKIVLSPGNEFVDFALEIGRVANIYKDHEDYLETVNYFKLFKSPI